MLRVIRSEPSLPLLLQRFVGERSGASAVMVGFALAGMLGLAGLGTEGANWYVTKRTMQGAADGAAYGAALAAPVTSVYTTEAKAIAATYGFVDQQAGVTVTVNNPPKSGNYTSDPSAIEVIIQQPKTRLLSAFYLASNPIIAARAVALRGSGADCILALSQTASGAVSGGGTTNVDLVKCGIADNSDSPTAMSLTGGASITADSANVVGDISTSSNSTLTTVSNAPVTGARPVQDPYATVQIPSYSGCDYKNWSPIHGSPSYDAGGGVKVVCGGVKINAGSTLTLSDGIFIIDGGSLDVAGGATLIINNATIVLTSSSGNNYGSVTINGGATVTATAPTTGAMAGIAFFQDRNAPSNVTDNFNGGSGQNITGAIYMPSQTVSYTGGASTGSQCTQVIGNVVTLSGNSTVQSNCAGTGVKTIASLPKQVE